MKFITIFCICLFITPNKIDPQIKRIRQDGHDLEFYVLPKKEINVKENRRYFWFKSGQINSSVGNYDGDIVHGSFTKTSQSNKLVEKGDFKLGLKSGEWQSWDRYGSIHESIHYFQGIRNGDYKKYDSDGSVIITGSYSQGKQSSTWINYKTADTTLFKNGAIYIAKPKDTIKLPFVKRIYDKIQFWRKPNNDSIKVQKEIKKPTPRRRRKSNSKKS